MVFTGASAGGSAAYTWSNYVRKLMDNPGNMYTIADSCLFANVSLPGSQTYVYSENVMNMWKVSNIDEKHPMEACNKKYPGEEWRCLFVQHSI